MTLGKVFVSRNYHAREVIELLEEQCEVEEWPSHEVPPKSAFLEKLAGSDAVMTEGLDVIDEDILDAAKDLKVIGNRAVGTDNLDILAATERGVLVTNTPGILIEACGDMTFALLLDAARRIAYSDRAIRAGEWKFFDQTPYLGLDAYGTTLGIVGMGGIGQAVARRAVGFDMRILYYSRTRKPEAEEAYGAEWTPDLDALLGQSDFVTLHVPLTDETRGLMGRAEFEQMKPSAVFINTARGAVADQDALYRALANGKIAGAALDVMVPEPIPLDDPLFTLPNVVFTPHIASASAATFTKMGIMAVNNITAALSGQPMGSCLNPEALDNRR